MPRPKSTPADFWSHVQIKGPDECWPWTGYVVNGHGRLSYHGKTNWDAHRLAWVLTHGEPPPGMQVLHACNNGICCNYVSRLHLYLGTNADNALDAQIYGTFAGERNGRSKLTREQVEEIRSLYRRGYTQARLAQMFGMGKSQIGNIVRGEQWT